MSFTGHLIDITNEAKSWPTACPFTWEQALATCCNLHRVVPTLNPSGWGCQAMPVGTHSSVKAMYASGVRYCHAEEGQRVLDYEVYRGAVFGDALFVQRATAKSRVYFKRYHGGYPVDVSVYGAGYCYLWLFLPTIRSRMARILGPLPLVADVVRLAWYSGAEKNRDLDIKSEDGVSWHVEPVGKDFNIPSYVAINFLIDIVRRDRFARVGMRQGSEDEVVNRRVRGSVQIMRALPLYQGVASLMPVVGFSYDDPETMKVVGFERLGGLRKWFETHGVGFPHAMEEPMLLATTASAMFSVGMSEAKRGVALWSLLGGTIIKLCQVAYSISGNAELKDYTDLNLRATNVNLTKIFHSSGLSGLCNLGVLSKESRSNAVILESVIGVVSVHCKNSDLLKLLRALSLIPHDEIAVGASWQVYNDVDVSEVKLTHAQLERAKELAALGKLG